MSSTLVVDEKEDALTAVSNYQARKLLACHRDGDFDVGTKIIRSLTRAEVGELLRDTNGPKLWDRLALTAAAAHQHPSVVAGANSDNVFNFWTGAAERPSDVNADGFRKDLCATAVEVLTLNPGKYAVNPDHVRKDYFPVFGLLRDNADFQADMRIALGKKRAKSYLGVNYYKGIRSLASIGEKDVLLVLEAIAQDRGSQCEDDGYGATVDVINLVTDPRDFVDLILQKAPILKINLTTEDALRIAYVLYYKRYEYVNAALDLRNKAAAILGNEPEYTPVEASMVDRGLTLHDRHCMHYGTDVMSAYVATAQQLGFTLGQRVYFVDERGLNQEGTLLTFRPSTRSTRIVAMVSCLDNMKEPYLVQLIQPVEPAIK